MIISEVREILESDVRVFRTTTYGKIYSPELLNDHIGKFMYVIESESRGSIYIWDTKQEAEDARKRAQRMLEENPFRWL